MGSRIREDVRHFFECFCEIAKPQPEKEAWIVQKFPESYKDEEVLKSVPKFAFPCEFESTSVQHFNFVLTDIDSKWTFGFVRHGTRSETALVVLSYLPWHEAFQKFLNTIADLTDSPNDSELWSFLEAVYELPAPDPGSTLHVSFNQGSKSFTCQCPNQFKLPSIPDNRNLTEYYSAVDANNMMVIFASMLYERRIIFTSKRLSRLSACVQAANAVLYPMNWQHIFIPVLPMSLMDYLLAPMPFLIGVPTPVLQRVPRSDLGDVVILNADANTVESPYEDLESLPFEVVSTLKRKLRNRATLLGDGVSRAFLQALVQLIGGYRDALRFYQGEKITFNEDAFVESRPSSIQPFLRKMLHLQIFQQFIEERLDMLNAGLGFSDEFELEACNYSEKSSSKLKQQYKEWASTMKKEGSAFFKTVKNRANPAVKSAVKTVKARGLEVKERSRTAYKGIRSKFRDSHVSPHSLHHDHHDTTSLPFNGKPRSAPASPTATPRRPKTLADPGVKSYYKDQNRFLKPASDNRGRSLSAALASPDSSPTEKPLQISPIDMDLLGDLQHLIFRDCQKLGEEAKKEIEGGESKPTVDRSPSGDLIQLDSTPSEDDFDPLKPSGRRPVAKSSTPYSADLLSSEQFASRGPHHSQESSSTSQLNQTDRDLLKEYGLEFASANNWLSSGPFEEIASASPNPKGQWATFD
ncbi:DENN domain-containing protein 1A-like isoform X2 [Neocloeon triangulifer]|uniref:DENN domain-containing protein 1A-like isoform X2 n=1 Tax=Neocloeon triangulifer TaxID=2078957 RepID=UPI00286F642D|nr:DENN domain-containing protein 1A-like isoform X2 [Neocloeon triangulifer]